MKTGFHDGGSGALRASEPERALADAQGWRLHLIVRLLGRGYDGPDSDLQGEGAVAEQERALAVATGLRRFLILRLLRPYERPPDYHILW